MRCNLDATFCDFARLSSKDYGVVFRFYTTFNIFFPAGEFNDAHLDSYVFD